jgi:hypothetical protein
MTSYALGAELHCPLFQNEMVDALMTVLRSVEKKSRRAHVKTCAITWVEHVYFAKNKVPPTMKKVILDWIVWIALNRVFDIRVEVMADKKLRAKLGSDFPWEFAGALTEATRNGGDVKHPEQRKSQYYERTEESENEEESEEEDADITEEQCGDINASSSDSEAREADSIEDA